MREFQRIQMDKGISAEIELADRDAEIPFYCDEHTLNDEYDMVERAPGEVLSGEEERERKNAFLRRLGVPDFTGSAAWALAR
ncbi:hypothetical protein ACF3MZ_03870 [Paenibacillaceae bacterium WGS1546]|uniref:hypothetical protein n=1 Tax=Cohnella sp. WGS1546 TaxID=3366810 RepID=UPI00372D44C6